MTRRPSVVSVWTSHATGHHFVALDNEDRIPFGTTEGADRCARHFGVRVLWDDWTDGMTVRHYALAPIGAEVPA